MNTPRDLVKIGLVGNIFEWYEFIIYAYLANVIGQLFFNAKDSTTGLIQSFSVFAMGYLARPLGSLFFGMMGDRSGRAAPLKISLLMAAIPTALIGLLPTYHDVGLLAPILLLTLRLVQGFAMGAEVPANACYIFECSPTDHQSILCSTVMVGSILGKLLASFAVFLVFQLFDHQSVLRWAWRLPFLFGIPLAIYIGAIRRTIHDFPISREHLHNKNQSNFETRVLKQTFINGLLLVSFFCVTGYVLLIWMPSYLIHFLNYPPHLVRIINIFFLISLAAFTLLAGYSARFVGVQTLIKTGLTAIIILIYPLFAALREASFVSLLMISLLLALLHSSIQGVIMQALAIQFPYSKRCRAVNLVYTLPMVFLGGTAPLVNTWMIQKTGLLMFPALYILFFGILALPAAWRLKGVEDGVFLRKKRAGRPHVLENVW